MTLNNLESVVYSDKRGANLNTRHWLSQLHSMYWGISMKEEEDAWLCDHKADVDSHLGIVAQGTGDGREEEKMEVDSGGQNVSVGDGDEEEIDEEKPAGDYIPGCHLLKMNPRRTLETIWVRAEYIRIFDLIMRDIQEDSHYPIDGLAFVLTGLPGIGKTVWQRYALRRCLAEQIPVIFVSMNRYHLFVAEGVYVLPGDINAENDFKTSVLILIDSIEFPSGLPSTIVSQDSKLIVVYTTSPSQERWKKLHQSVRRVTLVMNPWTLWEIQQLASSRIEQNTKAIDDLFYRLGPTPRICIDYLSNPKQLASYEEILEEALISLTPKILENLIWKARNLDMSEISYKLFLVQRKRKEVVMGDEILPISDYVSMRLSLKLRDYRTEEQVRIYRLCLMIPGTRALAGNLFESYGQSRFRQEIFICYYPMMRERRKGSHWHSPPFTTEPGTKMETLDIMPSDRKVYDPGAESLDIQSGVFYSLDTPNRVTFDCFILSGDRLYIFQFTVAKRHKGKTGIVPFLRKCHNIPAEDRWVFIFIIPESNESLSFSAPGIPGFKPFCAQLEVG